MNDGPQRPVVQSPAEFASSAASETKKGERRATPRHSAQGDGPAGRERDDLASRRLQTGPRDGAFERLRAHAAQRRRVRRRDGDRTAVDLLSSGRNSKARRPPQALESVEGPRVRREDVHDEVEIVDEHPFGARRRPSTWWA